MADDFYRQLGTGVSSLTFGVALAIFIYAAQGVSGLPAWLLFGASFLLMLRFWWRYNELFVQSAPSRNFWHFLFDFIISFFGILAVLFVSSIQIWAALGMAAMAASLIRCGLSWPQAKARPKLKRTSFGAILMLVILGAAYWLAPMADHLLLAGMMFILVLAFVAYSAKRP